MRPIQLPSLVLRASAIVLALGWLLAMMIPAGAESEKEAMPRRIIAIGGSVTEIVFALGQQDRLVGRDTTSVYPPEASAVADVGYIRALSPEGVLSVNPDLILALEGAGPPETVGVLEESGIPLVTIPEGYDGDAIVAKIRATGKALGVPGKADELADKVSRDLAAATTTTAKGEPKRVLFILSMQGGRVMAAGSQTHADAMIRLAGGTNALDDMNGYKQVSDEAVIEAKPDVILMMDRRGDHAISDDDLFSNPAISPTPAGINRNVVRMDGLYLLGFGPRTAEAVRDLGAALNEQSHAARK
ncbi:MAG: hemin ABC transporter substrate-binding protein [Flavobacteriaceae bacterium]